MSHIRSMHKADFDYIVSVLDRWWDGPAGERAHPVFFHELGHQALVAEDNGTLVGFLLGFVAPTEPPTGYIHFVGIHPDHRQRGVGKELYEAFSGRCREAGAQQLKAIAAVGDERSARFHASQGFHTVEVPDYAGRGRARMVFTRAL